MGAVDINGIYQYDQNDSVSPIHTFENLGQASISLRVRAVPYLVADVAARNALVSGRTINAANPLLVWRGNADTGLNLEYTINGTNWNAFSTEPTWVDIALDSAWGVIHSSETPQYRVLGDMVELRGSARRTAGLGTTYNLMAGGLPGNSVSDGAYPVMNAGLWQLGASSGNSVAQVNIRSDGGLRVSATAAVGSNAVVTLNGVRYKRAV